MAIILRCRNGTFSIGTIDDSIDIFHARGAFDFADDIGSRTAQGTHPVDVLRMVGEGKGKISDAKFKADLDGLAVLVCQRGEFEVTFNVGGPVAANHTATRDDGGRAALAAFGHPKADMIEVEADFIADNELAGYALRRE